MHRDLARASLPPPVCLTQARWSCLHFLAISLLCSAQHLAFFSFSPRFSWGFRRDARWVLLMRSEGDLLSGVNEARQELIGQYQRAVNNISVLISSAQKSKQGLHPVSEQGRHLHHVTHLLLPWLTLGSVGLRWGFPAGFGTTFPCIKIHAKSIIAVFRPACLTASTVPSAAWCAVAGAGNQEAAGGFQNRRNLLSGRLQACPSHGEAGGGRAVSAPHSGAPWSHPGGNERASARSLCSQRMRSLSYFQAGALNPFCLPRKYTAPVCAWTKPAAGAICAHRDSVVVLAASAPGCCLRSAECRWAKQSRCGLAGGCTVTWGRGE